MTYHLFTYLWRNIYLSLFLSFWSDILLLRFRITLIMLHYSLHYGYWSLSDVHFANIFFCFVSDLLLCWWLPFPVLIYDVLFCPVSLFFSLFSCSFEIFATFIVEGLFVLQFWISCIWVFDPFWVHFLITAWLSRVNMHFLLCYLLKRLSFPHGEILASL